MNLLAVETATEACSAALNLDGTIVERYQRTQRDHSRLILPMIDELLSEAGLKPQDLDALAFGRGPGSFTGVRIAAGVIHGIALGLELPIVPVSTLAAVAQDYFDQQPNAMKGDAPHQIAYVAMDARMGEIYWGAYQVGASGYAELLGIESVGPASRINGPDLDGVGIGTGWAVYREALLARMAGRVHCIESDHWPRARAVASLGGLGFESGLAVDVEQAMPVYLRDNVAKKESER